MNEKYIQQLEKLSELLVTPDKIGHLALNELYTPVELAQISDAQPNSGALEL